MKHKGNLGSSKKSLDDISKTELAHDNNFIYNAIIKIIDKYVPEYRYDELFEELEEMGLMYYKNK